MNLGKVSVDDRPWVQPVPIGLRLSMHWSNVEVGELGAVEDVMVAAQSGWEIPGVPSSEVEEKDEVVLVVVKFSRSNVEEEVI